MQRILRYVASWVMRLSGVHDELLKLQENMKKISYEIDNSQMQTGWLDVHRLFSRGKLLNLHDAEFRIYSQWGDDGIIQYLVRNLPIRNELFLEFGVSDYIESNTRYLLRQNNWKGVVFDSDEKNVLKIKQSEWYWRHDVDAVPVWVTCENINEAIRLAGLGGDIGFLHIDIDGNDYWIWKSITEIIPTIVCIEYNSVFGPERSISVPYRPDFDRFKAHYSGLFFGASLAALCNLGLAKGYTFVGSNSAGNNAYFVLTSSLNDSIPQPTIKEGYVASKFRESRDKEGRLTLVSGHNRLKLIEGSLVMNTETNVLEML